MLSPNWARARMSASSMEAKIAPDGPPHGQGVKNMDRRRFMQGIALASAGSATSLPAQTGGGINPAATKAKGQTRRLAEYASSLRYEDIPADVIQPPKHSLPHTLALIIFRRDLPR